MMEDNDNHYIRLGDVIVDSRTTCTPEQCDQDGCNWPDCSVEVRKFTSTKAADDYQRELEMLGNEVST